MKDFKIVLVGILLTTLLVTCGEKKMTFNDNIKKSLATYFKVDSVSNMVVVDSIASDDLTIMLADLYDAKILYEQDLLSIPLKLDTSNINLYKANKDLENSNSILDFAFEEIVEDWKRIIITQEENLKMVENLNIRNDTEIEFLELAEKGILNNIAYYLVNFENNKEKLSVAVDPKFKILRVFE